MMRSVLIMVLLVAFAAQAFNRSFIVLGYYTNTAAFEKACENKAQPKLQCHGKCQLMKKLKAEEKKEHQNPERKTDTQNDYLLNAAYTVADLQAVQPTASLYPHFTPAAIRSRSFAIFHPPAAV